MIRSISVRGAIGGLLASFLCMSAANAQNSTSFIEAGGDDALTCADSGNACRTLSGGLDKTDPGGQILILNSGNYFAVSIDQSVSIRGDQTHATVNVFGSTHGIRIDAGPTDVVHIDGITLDGAILVNDYGIRIVEAAAVHLRNCVIRNFKGTPGAGLAVESTVNVRVYVENCVFSNNDVGVLVDPTAGATVVTLDNVSIEKNSAAGITADGAGANVLVNGSVLTSNFGPAFNAINGGKIFSFGNNAVASNTAFGTATKLNLQ